MSDNQTNENLQLFEDQPIRTAWNETEEEWYFSIVDVVGVLTNQPDARHASTAPYPLCKTPEMNGKIHL